MIFNYDFGIRSVPPCGDCDERGHCTMNCGPRVVVVTQPSEFENGQRRQPGLKERVEKGKLHNG